MLDAGFEDRRHDQARTACQARQQVAGFVQGGIEGAPLGRQARLDVTFGVFGQVTDFQQAVDEQTQALVGRKPSGRGVRRRQQTQSRQVLHRVADRCR